MSKYHFPGYLSYESLEPLLLLIIEPEVGPTLKNCKDFPGKYLDSLEPWSAGRPSSCEGVLNAGGPPGLSFGLLYSREVRRRNRPQFHWHRYVAGVQIEHHPKYHSRCCIKYPCLLPKLPHSVGGSHRSKHPEKLLHSTMPVPGYSKDDAGSMLVIQLYVVDLS